MCDIIVNIPAFSLHIPEVHHLFGNMSICLLFLGELKQFYYFSRKNTNKFNPSESYYDTKSNLY